METQSKTSAKTSTHSMQFSWRVRPRPKTRSNREASAGTSPSVQGDIDKDKTRAKHTKSHHGCLACKARKVKCSEDQPACYHCRRRNEPCEYPLLQLRGSAYTSIALRRSSHNGSSGPLAQSPSSPMNLTDLRLMHNFVLYATPVLPLGNRHTWKTDVAARASETSFLMHAVLALSASHLGLRDESMSASTALFHRQLAIQGVQAVLCKPQPSSDELQNVLAASYALAHQSCYTKRGTADSIAFYKGIEALVAHPQLKSLSYSEQLFHYDLLQGHILEKVNDQLGIPIIDPRILDSAEASLILFQDVCQDNPVHSTCHKLMLEEVQSYRLSYAQGSNHSKTRSAWMFGLEDREILRSTEPSALLLLAHRFAMDFILDRSEALDDGATFAPVKLEANIIASYCEPLFGMPEFAAALRWPMQVSSSLHSEYDGRVWLSLADAFDLVADQPELFF